MPRIPLLCAAVLVCLTVRAGAQAPERLFYYVDTEAAFHSFERHAAQVSVIAPQVYTVDSLGIVWGEVDPRVVRIARANGVHVMPLVKNEGFDQPALRRLLRDTVARARATRSIADICSRGHFWGMQFDIENINIDDRDAFTAWYAATARALHAAGCKISVAVVHRLSDEAGATGYDRFLQESWRAGYDLAALARAGDFVSLMTYSEHTRRTPPGPVAALPWVRANVEYALRYVPASRLSVGIPLYGEHWFVQGAPALPERARSTAESVSWSRGLWLAGRYGAAIEWDSTAQVPFARWPNGGTYEWEFLENARSIGAKLDLMRKYRLRGFSAWVLGMEDEAMWPLLGPR